MVKKPQMSPTIHSGKSKPVDAIEKPNAPITPEDHIRKQIAKLRKKIEEIDKLDVSVFICVLSLYTNEIIFRRESKIVS